MTVAAGVGSIKGVYDGQVRLTDQQEPGSFRLHAQGAGAAGTIGADVAGDAVRGVPDGGTSLTYDADATVGGMIGGVGQRMLVGVSKKHGGGVLRATWRRRSLASARSAAGPTAAGRRNHPARSRLPPDPSTVSAPPAPAGRRSPARPRRRRVFTGARAGERRGGRRRRAFAQGVVVGAAAALAGAVVGGVDLRRTAGLSVADIDCLQSRRGRWRRPSPARRSRRASCSTCTSRGSRRSTRTSTRSCRSTRSGPAPAPRRPTSGRRAASRSVPLHGLPHAFKDTHEVAGWRTTFGSPLRADYVPKRDELVVERIRAAGVVPIGKTNVPEWAAGSHTFNPVFGTTRNPYDLTRSAGGSSGGAAAGAGERDGAAGRRQRHGRLAAQPGVVQQRRRAAAERRTGARAGRPRTAGS